MTAAVLALLLAVPDLHVRPPAPELRLRLDVETMTREEVTQGAIIAAATALLVYELLLVYQRDHGGTTPPTISQVMEQWGQKYGFVDWTAGNLIGHWFLPDDTPLSPRGARQRVMVLGFLTAGVLLWDVCDHSGRDRTKQVVLLLGGVLSGHVLAPQTPR